ncbi:MAG: M14 family zinc carboxypeptidase [Bacteroidota bacterium]
MKLKLLTTVFLFFLLTLILYSAENNYSYVRIYFDNQFNQETVQNFDIDLEGIVIKDRLWVETIASPYLLKQLNSGNIKYDILISDLCTYYQSRLHSGKQINETLLSGTNFRLGSMGGYLTLSEIDSTFAKMHSLFPKFAGSPVIIGKTIEGRDIVAYQIGDTTKKNVPEALITSLHHAREPAAMMAMVYFVWNLLERSEAGDEEAVFLLSNRKLWVIPVVNPDGYRFNEISRPGGGGGWRKNRRKHNDTTYGVDINRNYGPNSFWNAANDGASKSISSDTYRGSAEFSEPETQAIRDFCQSHKFTIALNYHTYGNVLIFPWGAKAEETPDSTLYKAIGREFSKFNKLSFGRAKQLIGYEVSGDSDDWMYLSNPLKSKIFSMTPELGTNFEGFWPPTNRILPIALENLNMNYQLLWSADANIRPIELLYSHDSSSNKGKLSLTLKNIGVHNTSDNVYLTIKSLDNSIEVKDNQKSFLTLNSGIETRLNFEVNFLNNFVDCSLIPFEVEILNEGVYRRDTIEIRIFNSKPEVLLKDGVIPKSWDLGNWGFEKDALLKHFVLTDSPIKNYPNINDNFAVYTKPLFISDSNVFLKFSTKWFIEPSWDFFVVQVLPEKDTNWICLESSRMRIADPVRGGRQLVGMTGFDGFFGDWLTQEISLSQFYGQHILLRFGVLSDNATNYNGAFLDDINVYFPVFSFVQNQTENKNINFTVAPNPCTDFINLSFRTTEDEIYKIELYDIFGNIIFEGESLNKTNLNISTLGMNSGIYFILIKTRTQVQCKKITILK